MAINTLTLKHRFSRNFPFVTSKFFNYRLNCKWYWVATFYLFVIQNLILYTSLCIILLMLSWACSFSLLPTASMPTWGRSLPWHPILSSTTFPPWWGTITMATATLFPETSISPSSLWAFTPSWSFLSFQFFSFSCPTLFPCFQSLFYWKCKIVMLEFCRQLLIPITHSKA